MAKPGRPKSDLRERLIEAGEKIFSRRGYRAATVEAVIQELGISKGGYYHHFASKEELFDAVVDKMARAAADSIRQAAALPGAGALEKFNRVLSASRGHRLLNAGLMRELAYRLDQPVNALVRRKMRDRYQALLSPLLVKIISQGRAEGVFDCPSIGATAELLVEITALARQKSAAILEKGGRDGQTALEVSRNINFHLEAMERLLGAPPLSLNRVEPDRVRVFVESYLARGLEENH